MRNDGSAGSRWGLVLSVVVLCVCGSPLDAQERMPLDEAIQRALERSPQMAQARQAVENAGWTNRTTLGAFLPTVNTNSNMSIRSAVQLDPNTGEIRQGSADSYSAGISASYEVFSGLSRLRERQSAAADYTAAEARMVDSRYAVVLQTQTAFFQALRQEELVSVAEARVAQAEQSLNLTRTRAQLREATISDTLRARLELVNARQALLQAEVNVRTSRVNLGRQVGMDGPVFPETPEGLEPAALSLSDEEILSVAASRSPAVLAAEASEVSAQASAKASRSQWFPSLRMSSGYNWQNQAPSLGGGATSWNWGLSASLPLFNGFGREAQIGRADQTLRVARIAADDARLGARAEANAALETLRTAELAIEIAQEALVLAQEDLRVIQTRYGQGVARIFDVVQSQIALDQARIDLVGARYDYVLARAQLEAIVGGEL